MTMEHTHQDLHQAAETLLAKAPKGADETRQQLVLAAFLEMHEQGFRNASLSRILERVGVTKGALYHHFKNKDELGYAVIDEVIWTQAQATWGHLLEGEGHVVDRMADLLRGEMDGIDDASVSYGCPVNNLVQEMSSVDEGFRQRLERIQCAWREALQRAIEQGQADGQIRLEVDAARFATLMVASYEGCNGIAKCARSSQLFKDCVLGMIDQLETLRA
jgi:TetR/AcrR family transcriptional regulator, transcriptional repressor for nem operon